MVNIQHALTLIAEIEERDLDVCSPRGKTAEMICHF